MVSIKHISSLRDEDLILAPDVDVPTLRSALEELSRIVGSDNIDILTKDHMMPDEDGHYFNVPREHDIFYVLEKDTFLASAVVSPKNTEEVSAIVKLANKVLLPLWPISRGRNLGMLFIIMNIIERLLIGYSRLWGCCTPSPRKRCLGHGEADESCARSGWQECYLPSRARSVLFRSL